MSGAPPPDSIFSVSSLTREIHGLLDATFGNVWVQGEVSRVVYASSGHVYLTLKDEDAVLDAVIWRSTVSRLRFRVQEGQEVLARGGIDVYAPRGQYKLIIRELQPQGAGALQLAFEQMRKRLAAEGLFDEEHKQALPFFPRRVILITSPTGAAVRDMIKVIHGRLPSAELALIPVRVQGDGAAEEVARALRFADAKGQADVILVGRGGGSLEDLWAFNEEVVARAIAACRTPVVSAVGHETDFTIADYVADQRAATPSHAGELVVPSAADLERRLQAFERHLQRGLRRGVDAAWQHVEALADRPVLRDVGAITRPRRERLAALAARLAGRSPAQELKRRQENVAGLAARLTPPLRRRVVRAREALDALGPRGRLAMGKRLDGARRQVASFDDQLRALSPLAVLGRGYSLTTGEDGRVLRRVDDVTPGQILFTRLADGARLMSRLEDVDPG